MKRKVAIPYYGGKASQLSWLLPLFPQNKSRFVDVFGGSASVLLNIDPPYAIEVYNDINHDVVNFFTVLRDHTDELIKRLILSPYSRAEFLRCRDAEPTDDIIEEARKYFVLARQSFMGTQRSWAVGLQVRHGWSQMISRYTNGILGLTEIVARLSSTIIECRDALEVIRLYDDEDTFMYLDPPYPPESRVTKKVYAHEMARADHVYLLELITLCESSIAISGYKNALYSDWLKDWFVYEDKEKQLAGPRGRRQELVWCNYDYTKIRPKKQTGLDEYEM